MDGTTCKDYNKLGKSYGECIENGMKDLMLKWFGCFLPWMPETLHPVCKAVEQTETNFLVLNDTLRFLFGFQADLFQTCSPPCHRMSFNLEKVDKWVLSTEAKLVIDIAEKVTVQTDYYAYDEFSFIVDLGSALGLWLGLSAVSIVEAILHIFNAIRNVFNQWRVVGGGQHLP